MSNSTHVSAVFLLAALAAAGAAPDKAVDTAALKEKVTITLGKKLFVQFQQKGNELSEPKIVRRSKDKEKALNLEFRKDNDMLMLITQNPFAKTLQFRAAARLKGRKEYFETSIVPIMAGLASFELWQDPIEELVLFDFKLIDEKP